VEKMNPPSKQGIMADCKHLSASERREYREYGPDPQ
jgi:hypothetical protein